MLVTQVATITQLISPLSTAEPVERVCRRSSPNGIGEMFRSASGSSVRSPIRRILSPPRPISRFAVYARP